MLTLEKLFGGRTAALVLLYLHNYEEGYAREIAATFGLSHGQVLQQLNKLEDAGLLLSRLRGRTRMFTWSPRNPLVRPLRALLEEGLGTLAESEIRQHFRARVRPRTAGKAT